jgi:putative colanic acid biosynthesis acetyltransferase WcaB
MTYVSFHDFYDLVAAELGATQGVRLKLLIFLYRVASYGVFKQGAYRVLTLPFYILYRLYAEFLLGIELPVQVIAGRGLAIFHGQGLVVHKDTKIGARCILRQGVTIGNKRLRDGT